VTGSAVEGGVTGECQLWSVRVDLTMNYNRRRLW